MENNYVLETCFKKNKTNIVFCLILTELFLLKYIHKQMVDVFIWPMYLFTVKFKKLYYVKQTEKKK